jgi:hypothetical protein
VRLQKCEKRLLVLSRLSVRPSECNNWVTTRRIFKIFIFNFFFDTTSEISSLLTSEKNEGYLNEELCTFIIYRAELFLKLEIFQINIVEENKFTNYIQ